MPDWLDGFLSEPQFEHFFAHVGFTSVDFDVLKLPGEMWPNLFLLHVQGDGSLPIAVAGDNLTASFSRDLKGADLTAFLHGPASDDVVDAFRRCVAERVCVCLRKHVHLHGKGITRVVEGAMAPILHAGQVRKIVGCLYFYDLDQETFCGLPDLASVKPLPENTG
ncbi:PAS domain-containing protein [Pelagibius sp. CAU 1746]|uniref:PAS domain-containing protein n=1 Tax=Pelagibius sp. CAU 1746 TaxID=3140370 RepID=UPI00325BB394